jgi:hypothetical protein
VGLCAASLLLFHPIFWRAGLTNQVRLFLSFEAIALAWMSWRIAEGRAGRWGLAVATGVAGIAAGFRPFAAVLILPALAWAAWRSRQTLRSVLLAMLSFCAGVSVWLWYTVEASGGLAAYTRLLRSYALEQGASSAVLLGASLPGAAAMAGMAAVWGLLGVVTWIWLLPFVCWRELARQWKRAIPLLACWLVPAFTFHAFAHVGDPEHMLSVVPICSLAGSWVVVNVARRVSFPWLRHPAALIVVTGIVLCLRIALFMAPPTAHARAASYASVAELDKLTRTVFADLDRVVARTKRVYLIHAGNPISWRKLSYYYPNLDLLVLADPAARDLADAAWEVKHRQRRDVVALDGRLVLPNNATIVWMFPPNPAPRRQLEAQGVFYWQSGLLAYHLATPGQSLDVAGARFAVEKQTVGVAAQ